jgi:hypothetical protein
MHRYFSFLLALTSAALLGGCYTQLATRPAMSEIPSRTANDSTVAAPRDTVIVEDEKICYEEYNLLGYPEIRCYDSHYPYGWHRYYNQPWWRRPHSSWYNDCDCNCSSYYDYYYPRTRFCRDYCDGYCDGRWTGGGGSGGGSGGSSGGSGSERSGSGASSPRGSRSSGRTPVLTPSSSSQSGSMKKGTTSSTNQASSKSTTESKEEKTDDSTDTRSQEEEKQDKEINPRIQRRRPGRGR